MRAHNDPMSPCPDRKEVLEFMRDISTFIEPLLPAGWRYSLLLQDNSQYNYWIGDLPEGLLVRGLSGRLEKWLHEHFDEPLGVDKVDEMIKQLAEHPATTGENIADAIAHS